MTVKGREPLSDLSWKKKIMTGTVILVKIYDDWEILDPVEEPAIVILLKSHAVKLPSNYLYLYP